MLERAVRPRCGASLVATLGPGSGRHRGKLRQEGEKFARVLDLEDAAKTAIRETPEADAL
jgi:hypothetical protein